MNEYEIDSLLEQIEEVECSLNNGARVIKAAMENLSKANLEFEEVMQMYEEMKCYLNYERQD